MHAFDSSGRQISLLNDHPVPVHGVAAPLPPAHGSSSSRSSRPPHLAGTRSSLPYMLPLSSSRSSSSSPTTPDLIRSDSYDSQESMDMTSPITPITGYDYTGAHHHHHHHHHHYPHASPMDDYAAGSMAPVVASSAVDEEPAAARPGKRYPCRYREAHGCDKTFTTSGHASRHSKIHTAEKAVQCTFPNCMKKFTRADNMKQHLETHYKDRSKSSSKDLSRRSSVCDRPDGVSNMQPASPSDLSWGVGRPCQPNRMQWAPTGLDALAMAVAQQEDAM